MPRPNTKLSCIFFPVAIFKLQSTGMGSITMKTSSRILMTPFTYAAWVTSPRQKPCEALLSQLKLRGTQMTRRRMMTSRQ